LQLFKPEKEKGSPISRQEKEKGSDFYFYTLPSDCRDVKVCAFALLLNAMDCPLEFIFASRLSSGGAAEVGAFLHHHCAGLFVVAAAGDVLQIGAGDADEARAGGISDGVDGAEL
jgi:hypothetical protein